MMITYRKNLTGVDWAGMKAALNADDFDNGRTPEQLRASFENSYGVVLAYQVDTLIGTARVLSDGVCNAYIVDVWTQTTHRRQGVARAMIELLTENLWGQHIFLFTDDAPEFYRQIGFKTRGTGFEMVRGEWLVNEPR